MAPQGTLPRGSPPALADRDPVNHGAAGHTMKYDAETSCPQLAPIRPGDSYKELVLLHEWDIPSATMTST